ncbi:protein of unknown function [Lentzea fradiae]|uniref:DUF397 domain-containing protein n=1 Tax=Lentzea fradiae TaxID=200378 RepID=A0A1G8BXG0_9PSEU|nr:DUF397 domain-containing protein [Lentzea fradiae]SDH37852.1 protein of unknown function [Lentzea fradiae]
MANELLRWRKSTYSGSGDTGGGECVEIAWLSEDRIALRDSKNPGAGTVTASRAWLRTVGR